MANINRYGDENSRYCYSGTNILKNHAKIQDATKLAEFESALTISRLAELVESPITGNFDTHHLLQIHHYIFQDIYPFAGLLREENIAKGSFVFAQVPYIASSLTSLLDRLNEEQHLNGLKLASFSNRLAYYLSELNAFREGNGRVIREFIRYLAAHAGYELDWSKVEPKRVLDASIRSTVDLEPLIQVLILSLSAIKK